jgi:hypothetical protein
MVVTLPYILLLEVCRYDFHKDVSLREEGLLFIVSLVVGFSGVLRQ